MPPECSTSERHDVPHPAIPRSRWTLQQILTASHAGLVTIIVMIFATTFFVTLRQATFREAEADLLGAAQVLLENFEAVDDPAAVNISDLYLHRLGKAPRDHAFFILWDADGKPLARSGEIPDDASPVHPAPPREGPHPYRARTVGHRVDVTVATDQGGQLMIGRPLAKEFDHLYRILGELVVGSVLCIVAGIAAGRWLAVHIARPLSRIAHESASIHPETLGQTINAAAPYAELAVLETSLNDMLARLRAAFEQQKRFTADASHELRTPLSIILAQTEHTLSRDRTTDSYKAALTTCRDAAGRMRSLVDDLLLLARSDQSRPRGCPEPIDLASLVDRVINSLSVIAGERAIQIDRDLQPVTIAGDAPALERCVMNLLANALQYSSPETTIHVDLHPSETGAVLSIRDEGIGIDPADLPHVFDRFYRATQSRTIPGLSESPPAGFSGTGLGLSLVREIVKAHGGNVSLESVPHVGTTVRIQLPRAE